MSVAGGSGIEKKRPNDNRMTSWGLSLRERERERGREREIVAFIIQQLFVHVSLSVICNYLPLANMYFP